MLTRALRLLWPSHEKTDDLDENAFTEAELNAIEGADFSSAIDAVISAAITMYQEEEDRAKTAETKAFNMLLVVAALVSLLTYLESAIWDGKLGNAPKWLSLAILLIGVWYLARVGSWSVRAITVRVYHTIGPSDLARIWRYQNQLQALAKEIMGASVKNRKATNKKVAAVQKATVLLRRGIVVFCILLFVQGAWEIGTVIQPVAKEYWALAWLLWPH